MLASLPISAVDGKSRGESATATTSARLRVAVPTAGGASSGRPLMRSRKVTAPPSDSSATAWGTAGAAITEGATSEDLTATDELRGALTRSQGRSG